jgi:hypothetical protein
MAKVYPPFGSPMDGPGGLVARPWVIFFNWIFELISAAGDVSVTGAPSAGELAVWSGAASITNGNLSGDVTTSNSLVTTLAASGVTPGTYGGAALVPVIAVDAKGRITAAANISNPVGDVTHTGALTADQLVIGNGAADIKSLGAAGTTVQVLHGNAAGAPTFGAVSLTADVSGRLPLANVAQGTALSVLGVAGNATADEASIVAANDGEVLRRSGTSVGFGAVSLATAAAVTGILPNANLPAALAPATSITTPLVIGGTGVASTLILQPTSGVGAAGADVFIKNGNNGATQQLQITNAGLFMFGTPSTDANYGSQPASQLHVIGTAPQLVADYIAANNVPFALRGRKARGTVNAPSKALNNDNLVQLIGQAWEDVTPGWTSGPLGTIGIQATEDITAAAQGARLIINLVDTGGTTNRRQFTISSTGVTFGPCITPATVGNYPLQISTAGVVTSTATIGVVNGGALTSITQAANETLTAAYGAVVPRKRLISSGIKLTIGSGAIFRIL